MPPVGGRAVAVTGGTNDETVRIRDLVSRQATVLSFPDQVDGVLAVTPNRALVVGCGNDVVVLEHNQDW
ncbi:hypothetical protein [Embleya sp. NPDC020886]|uniref:hypothetical protein n=1 Tax=Embleya sp. NPDC020886 TaxID=3363980 RepID=UPI0037AF43A4